MRNCDPVGGARATRREREGGRIPRPKEGGDRGRGRRKGRWRWVLLELFCGSVLGIVGYLLTFKASSARMRDTSLASGPIVIKETRILFSVEKMVDNAGARIYVQSYIVLIEKR